MEEIKGKSNILAEISYYGRNMFIKLKDGRLFSYNGVPREVFDEFKKTEARDDFYMNRIVKKYSFQRIS